MIKKIKKNGIKPFKGIMRYKIGKRGEIKKSTSKRMNGVTIIAGRELLIMSELIYAVEYRIIVNKNKCIRGNGLSDNGCIKGTLKTR